MRKTFYLCKYKTNMNSDDYAGNDSNKRIIWIDMLRGFCMLLILWFHTEMYYAGYDVTPYSYYVGDALAVFFFLSGFLFYSDSKPFNANRKLHSVFRWLLIPYLIFTIPLSLLKALYHHTGIGEMVVEILTGHASWFVSSLIVAELLFIVALNLFQRRSGLMIAAALMALFYSSTIGNSTSVWYYEQDLWHVNEALLGFFIMTMGYFFHQYENRLRERIDSIFTLSILIVLSIGMKILIGYTHPQLIFGPIIVSNYYLFISDLLSVTLLLVVVFRRLPSVRLLEWVGQRSIVYYFIAGGIPLIVSKLLGSAGLFYCGIYSTLLAFAIVCVLSSLFVWAVYRYTNIVRPI